MKEKDNATTRIYSLNLNGLSLDWRGGQFGTTKHSFLQWYKPGGTLMNSIGNASGRVEEQSQDHMGR